MLRTLPAVAARREGPAMHYPYRSMFAVISRADVFRWHINVVSSPALTGRDPLERDSSSDTVARSPGMANVIMTQCCNLARCAEYSEGPGNSL
jgi:hypothetical protein